MTSNPSASPSCFVDIYPYEGGLYTLTSGDVLSVQTSKSIMEDVGTFRIVLAPSVVKRLSWAQVITPMSFAVIAMQRGNRSNVVMLGVVTRVTEQQIWNPGAPVTRAIVIEGQDFGYFLNLPDYYSLWFLAASATPSDVSLSDIVTMGLQQGKPADVGRTWYDTIMIGNGVLKNTGFRYNGTLVPFGDAVKTRFEDYDTNIPVTDYFLGVNDSWFRKFRAIFPSPFYEFFVTTDSGDTYGESGGPQAAFSAQGMRPQIVAAPAVVARINPLPTLVSSIKDGATSFDSIDVSRWTALKQYDLDGLGFLNSEVRFSEEAIANFYTLNPTWFSGLIGANSNNIVQPVYLYGGAADYASIARYGYRPQILNTLWFSTSPTAVSDDTSSFQQQLATALGRLAAYYEPLALMANATVRMNLRPDIEIGNRFTYAPFRLGPTQDVTTWDFYIETVSHTYVFGGETTTTLSLGRGLPSKVYGDTNTNGLLYNIHIGNAQRFQGDYKTGLPSGSQPALTGISSSKSFAEQLSALERLYTTPQLVTSSP